MIILAIDPGPEQSGWVLHDTNDRLKGSGVLPNAEMLDKVAEVAERLNTLLAIEWVASYGMPVGREVFDTCRWAGRFQQVWHDPEAVRLVYRKDVKLYLCGTTKAKDSNVRQALLDMYPREGGGAVPQIGTKAKPGPLYGFATHAWPALGVALYVHDQLALKHSEETIARLSAGKEVPHGAAMQAG